MTMVLPLSRSDSEVAQTRSAIPSASPSSLQILLAEDDPSVAGITQTMLGELGHEVICTPDAEQALQVLNSTAQVDLLLTDVIMPGGMNGVELAKEAIKIRPGLSVLLSSGYAGESIDEWVASGAWPFLKKPYLQSELADALARVAGERAAKESFPSHGRLARGL